VHLPFLHDHLPAPQKEQSRLLPLQSCSRSPQTLPEDGWSGAGRAGDGGTVAGLEPTKLLHFSYELGIDLHSSV